MIAEQGVHQAWVRIEDADAIWIEPKAGDGGRKALKNENVLDFIADKRWPAACACGYKFRENDERQVVSDLIYRRIDTGEQMTLREAPPGAMWDAWWLREANLGRVAYGGPDGRVISVKTPVGAWVLDGPSIDRPEQKWARTGEPPKITAWPAIQINFPLRYHAFLTSGVLKAFPLTANEASEAAAFAASDTGLSLSVVQVRPGTFVVMETNVALRHHLKIASTHGGSYPDTPEARPKEAGPPSQPAVGDPFGRKTEEAPQPRRH